MNDLIQYWPQVTIIAMSASTLAREIYKNEQPGRYEFPNPIKLLSMILTPVALFFGGFFHITIPFFIWLILFSMSVGLIFSRVGKSREKVSILSFLIVIGLIHGLYYWGGFYDVFLK